MGFLCKIYYSLKKNVKTTIFLFFLSNALIVSILLLKKSIENLHQPHLGHTHTPSFRNNNCTVTLRFTE